MPTWSGLWNGFYNIPYAPLPGGNTTDYNNTKRHQLAKWARGVEGRKLGAILRAITGAPVGATALSQTPVIPGNPFPGAAYSGGGKINAVLRTDINRATVTADETWFDTATLLLTKPTYPVDKAGVGGAKGPGFF